MRSPVDTIAAVATPPGRGGIGVVRVSGEGVPALVEALIGRPLSPRMATLATFRAANGDVLDQGLALHFPAPALLHRRARARIAGPWRPGGHAPAASALRGTRRGTRGAGGVHAARVSERQARPRAGRRGGGSHRRRDGDGRARRGAQPLRCVLARDPARGRRVGGAADADRGNARLPRRGHRFPAPRRRHRAPCPDTRGARGYRLPRPAGRAASRRAHDGHRRAAERRQVEPAQSTRGRGCRHRHPDCGDHARYRALADRARGGSGGRGRHGRAAADRRSDRDARHRARLGAVAHADLVLVMVDARDAPKRCCRSDAAILAQLPAALARVVVHNKIDLTDGRRRARSCAPTASRDQVAPPRLVVGENRRRGPAVAAGDAVPRWGCTKTWRAAFLRGRGTWRRCDAAGRHLAAAARHLTARRRRWNSSPRSCARRRRRSSAISGEFSADDLLGEIFSRFCIGK